MDAMAIIATLVDIFDKTKPGDKILIACRYREIRKIRKKEFLEILKMFEFNYDHIINKDVIKVQGREFWFRDTKGDEIRGLHPKLIIG